MTHYTLIADLDSETKHYTLTIFLDQVKVGYGTAQVQIATNMSYGVYAGEMSQTLPSFKETVAVYDRIIADGMVWCGIKVPDVMMTVIDDKENEFAIKRNGHRFAE